MTDPKTGNGTESPDPRDAMREALERKKNQQHGSASAGPSKGPALPGGPHGQAGGKRADRQLVDHPRKNQPLQFDQPGRRMQ